jgi:hypothetical protein
MVKQKTQQKKVGVKDLHQSDPLLVDFQDLALSRIIIVGALFFA